MAVICIISGPINVSWEEKTPKTKQTYINLITIINMKHVPYIVYENTPQPHKTIFRTHARALCNAPKNISNNIVYSFIHNIVQVSDTNGDLKKNNAQFFLS